MSEIKRCFLHLAYKGTAYRGWQRQKQTISIQQVIEETLAKKFGRTIKIMGCGRTDAGVHASQFFAHIDVEEIWDKTTLYQLNKMLPSDISLFDALPVQPNANAQRDAISRTYDYYVHLDKQPFLNTVSTWYQNDRLDLPLIKKGVSLITSNNDFYAFCKTPSAYKNTRCRVSQAQLMVLENPFQIRFQFTSNRFLRGMIRLMVARLLELGRGEISLEDWTAYLSDQKTLKHRTPAHPQGLHLTKVTYPYLEVPPKYDWATSNNEWKIL